MKKYRLYDLLDETDSRTVTLQQAREWLVGFWDRNPSDDMNEEEVAGLLKGISVADADELFDYLGGIGYCIEELEG